ncbi:MAG: SLC13 family permease [Arenimonas sp.]
MNFGLHALDGIAFGGFNGHAIAVLIFTALIFYVFIRDRFHIATVCLAILVTLPLLFYIFPFSTNGIVVDPLSFYAGFSHPALITICGLMILGQGLVLTGALEPAARWLAGMMHRRPKMALLLVLIVGASTSGLINDTPVVVILIPLLIAATRNGKIIKAAQALMPMNFAVLIGGMATSIGTSTNLIVIAIAVEMGLAPFGIFDFSPIVAVAATPALIYLWWIAPKMLKSVPGPSEDSMQPIYIAELSITAGGRSDGKELREIMKLAGENMQLLRIKRGEKQDLVKLPTSKLVADDRLVLQNTIEDLKRFEAVLQCKMRGATNSVDAVVSGIESGSKLIVAQLIVTPASELAGQTVRSVGVAKSYGISVIGLRHAESIPNLQRNNIADQIIAVGDILLVQGSEASIKSAQAGALGLLLDGQYVIPRQAKAIAASIIMAAVVALAATKTLPIAIAAMIGVAAMIATRCMNWSDLGHALSTKVVFLVVASLALGQAMLVSGAIDVIANDLAEITVSMDPRWVMATLMLVMGLMTNFVSNNAAAAIGTPLGIELARRLGVPPEAFALAVLFGCNLCYLTPMGYQTNLLVMNAARYRFSDFLRVGTPLFIIMWVGLSYGLAKRYGI